MIKVLKFLSAVSMVVFITPILIAGYLFETMSISFSLGRTYAKVLASKAIDNVIERFKNANS